MSAVPALSDPARAVVQRASEVVGAALDELGPKLLAASGRVAVEAKADGTPVTGSDRDVDQHLSAAIAAAFPDHGLLSEERDTVTPAAEWCWIIDPIDGTANFTSGLPYWCVSVALALEGEPVLGIVDAPVVGMRYTATRGGGAWRGSRPLTVGDRVDWRDVRNRHVPVMLSTGAARRARQSGLRLNPRVMGAVALDLAIVAEGVAAASVAMIPHVWDVAAGALLVREAGGVIVTLDGEPLLPMRPGDEHRDRSAVTAAGPDEDYVHELADRLLTGE